MKDKQYKQDRKEILQKWKEKGVDYCAEQLWNAKKKIDSLKLEMSRIGDACRDRKMEYDELHILRNVNKNMANVLRENGILPTKFRITYIDVDCENCPYNGIDDGEWDCQGCGEYFNGKLILKTKGKFTESIAFWTYRIMGHEMDGIDAHFDDRKFDLLKVVDEKTGEVIYCEDKESTT